MNIKEMREKTGRTQKEFAETFGIPLGTLRRWEYGESTPAPYVLKLIAEKLPMDLPSSEKIESSKGTYYYDKVSGIIEDANGTKIQVGDSVKGVNAQNLIIYTDDLFETYYEAVAKFKRDCKMDKKENILWG